MRDAELDLPPDKSEKAGRAGCGQGRVQAGSCPRQRLLHGVCADSDNRFQQTACGEGKVTCAFVRWEA